MKNVEVLIREARVAAEAAFRTLHPPAPFAAGESLGVGADLYRQAIHWALAAHDAIATKGQPCESSEPGASTEQALPALPELLDSTSASLLREGLKDNTLWEACVRHLRADYKTYAQLDVQEQRRLCVDLQSLYEALMLPLAPAEKALELALLKRNARWLGLGLVPLLIAFGTWRGLRWYKHSRDLALDATWTSSSIYNSALQCRSPDQECKEGKDFFFCTRQENNPWFVLDLETYTRFSSVEIVNREDCCRERANPLTVSVSKDGKSWQVVAERKTEFSTFTAEFPEVSARYVKLEIPKPASILHLTRVRVFP